MAKAKGRALTPKIGLVLDNSVVMAKLAIRRAPPLATIDGMLKLAAEAVGVALFDTS